MPCFDRWSEDNESAIFGELDEFVSSVKTPNTEHLFVNAILACVSTGNFPSVTSHFDHRHMFRIPLRSNRLVAVFIASPYLPADRLAIASRTGVGVCSSGIANSAAAKLLRTSLKSGLSCSIDFFAYFLCSLHFGVFAV